MLNLIFDLNNLFFRGLYSVGGFRSKVYTFHTQREIEQLMRKICIDLSYVIRQINPGRVIFCVDSNSWRKEIEIEENEGYKANREKSTYINWDNVFSILEELCEILSNNGFIVSKIDKAEADDLMCLWTHELLYNKRENVIIASSDEDVRQLVKSYWKDDTKKEKGDNQCFSCVFNPIALKGGIKKLYVPSTFNEWIQSADVIDIFNMSIDSDKDDFKKIISDYKIQIEEVDGDRIGVIKMLCGDDGDNVPAMYTWLKKNKEGKEVEKRITESIANKIIEKLKISNYTDVINNDKKIQECLIEISGNKPSFKIDKRIKRQAQLVILNPEIFPEYIKEKFNSQIEEKYSIKRMHGNDVTMQMLLEGTKYVSENYKESSIFKEIDQMTAKLF